MRSVKLGLASSIVALSIALTAAVPARAQPHPGGGGGGQEPSGGDQGGAPAGGVTSITAEQLAQVVTAAGFQNKPVHNGDTQAVLTLFWPNTTGGAILENCDKDSGQCKAYKIFANLGKATVSGKWINSWNNSWLYVHTYVLNNGELIFAWDVPLLNGLSPDYMANTFKLFKAIVDQSTEFKGD